MRNAGTSDGLRVDGSDRNTVEVCLDVRRSSARLARVLLGNTGYPALLELMLGSRDGREAPGWSRERYRVRSMSLHAPLCKIHHSVEVDQNLVG